VEQGNRPAQQVVACETIGHQHVLVTTALPQTTHRHIPRREHLAKNSCQTIVISLWWGNYACIRYDARVPIVTINALVAVRPAFVRLLPWKKQSGIGSHSINIDRFWNDIEMLATFSTGTEGVNRLTFSDEDRAAREYLRAQMVLVGFEVVEIPPGIRLGRLNPLFSSEPAVMSGSPIDAVPAAGRFDGIVGGGSAGG
jgi:hypothetical protein